MNCPACGQENRPGRRFCGECGKKLVLRCAACRADNQPDEKFCGDCGRPLPGTHERTSVPEAGYTPKYVAERIAPERRAAAGERKLVTVLFADVKSSMDVSAGLDPEEWHHVMDRFFSIMAEGVHRFEGTVNQYTGDGIMALFGAPIAHEDHAVRACHAALHLREALARFRLEVDRERGPSIAVRMGLNSGAVVVGAIGDDLRMDYTALGHTVGLAARMEQMAEPGHVLVSEHTAALVGGQFRLRDLGSRDVRGLPLPIHVFELEGVGELQSRLDVLRARRFSRFVGRATEMRILEGALERTRSGSGSVIGIVAEPGMGKSRLCSEFVERCRERGVPVYEGHCPSHRRLVPFQLVQQLVRAYCGVGPRDDAGEMRAKVEARIVHDGGARDALPLLYDFLGVPSPTEPCPALDPEVRQRRLFAALRRVLVYRSRTEPLAILVDDAQWIDAGSEAFVSELGAIAATGLLLVVNFRPEYRPPWSGRPFYQQLPLAPLGADAASELLGELLGDDPTTAPLAALVRERAGGNAFFLEEIVRSLVEDGFLDGASGHYRLARDVADLRLPPSVEVVLAARIDRLLERDKTVLQAAAVIGREFDEPLLRQVTALDADDLAASLDRLRAAEFVYALDADRVVRYAFMHPLVQEVAYREQLTSRRARMHGGVARAIEALATDRGEHYEALAHHYGHSLEREHAVAYHELAGDKARAAFSLELARRQYGAGVRLLDTFDATPERMSKRIDLASKWADAGLHGPTVEQLEAVRTSLAHAEALGDSARAARCLYWAAFLEYCLGDQRAAIGHYEQCIAQAEALGLEPLVVRLRCNLGHSHAAVTDYARALDLLTDGIARLRGDPAGTTQSVTLPYSLAIMGLVLGDMGRFAEAYDSVQDGLRLVQATGRRSIEASVYQTMAFVQAFHGRWSEGLATSLRTRALAEEVGAPYIVATTTTLEGWCRFHQGETRAGIDAMVDAIERLDRIRTYFTMSWSLACCADALARAGEPDAARRYAERALVRADELDGLGEITAHRALMTAVAAERPFDVESARHHYDAAEAAARRKCVPRETALDDLRFGEILAAARRDDEARALLERAHAAFERLDMPWWAERARDATARTRR
jgi:class 3 adenylate cyclase/tetratricopeptide (TPR) repeat protein